MPFGVVLLLINVGLIVHAAKTGRFWPWGWIMGVVLLIFSFPNDAQKRGYHDF